MPAFCYRCMLLSDDGDAYGRTCTVYRTTDRLEAERRTEIDARQACDAYFADRIDAGWNAGPTRAVAAGAAVTMMLAGQAHASVADADPAEPFVSIAVLFATMIAALVGMFWPWPWPFVRKSPADPHATPYGDVLTLPEGRRE